MVTWDFASPRRASSPRSSLGEEASQVTIWSRFAEPYFSRRHSAKMLPRRKTTSANLSSRRSAAPAKSGDGLGKEGTRRSGGHGEQLVLSAKRALGEGAHTVNRMTALGESSSRRSFKLCRCFPCVHVAVLCRDAPHPTRRRPDTRLPHI